MKHQSMSKTFIWVDVFIFFSICSCKCFAVVKMNFKNKKGSHIGVILSFIIFVTFVVFMITVLKPTSNIPYKGLSLVNSLKTNVENYVSVEVTSFIFTLQGTATCVSFDESNFSLSYLNHSVRNQNNEIPNSYRNSTILYIENSASDTIYKVDYSTQELNYTLFENPQGCEELTMNSIKKDKKIVEPKIIELITKQEMNYSGLKQDLKISSNKNFGIKFEFENSTKIGKEILDKKQITLAKKFQVVYLDLNANEKIGYFTVYIV